MFWALHPTLFFGGELRNWEVSNASNLPKFPRSHHRIEPILEGLSDAESEARCGEKPRRSRFVGSRGVVDVNCILCDGKKSQAPTTFRMYETPCVKKPQGYLHHINWCLVFAFPEKYGYHPAASRAFKRMVLNTSNLFCCCDVSIGEPSAMLKNTLWKRFQLRSRPSIINFMAFLQVPSCPMDWGKSFFSVPKKDQRLTFLSWS